MLSVPLFLLLLSSAGLDLCKIYLSLTTATALLLETFLLRAGATGQLHTTHAGACFFLFPQESPVCRWGSLPSPHVSTPTDKWSTSFAFPKALDYFTTESKSDKQVKPIHWVTLTLALLLGAGSIKKSGQMLYWYHFWSTLMNVTPGWSFKRV